MPRPTVTIIVVSYNTREAVRDCLRALARVRDEAELDVVVVDNASVDDTVGMIQDEFPDARLISNHENRGFAAAVNQGASSTQAEFFLMLNPDTWISRGALAKLLAVMGQDPRIAVVGAQLASFRGDDQGSVLAPPTLTKEFFNLLPELKAILVPAFLKRRLQRGRHVERRGQVEVPAVSGGAMLVRTRAFREAGGLDERFFVYHEEVDLCLRLAQRGWRIVFQPAAVVLHYDALATGFRTNRLPPEPVLSWRLRGTAVLFEKHTVAGTRDRFVRLACRLLRLRALLARWRGRWAAAGQADWARRAEELEMAAVSLAAPRSGAEL